MQVNGRRSLRWVHGLLAVVLFFLARWLGSTMELPTIDEKWGDYEKGENLGIYYDGSFVSVPSVKGVFSDGNAQISPMNSYEEAESLASTIRIGGLKLELEELHSKVVGAQLGVEAISTC